MKYTLPTQHVLYFGIQAKKDKLDASGAGRTGNANIAEIHAQDFMMPGHEIFDPEIGKRVLVDHSFIVSAEKSLKQPATGLGISWTPPSVVKSCLLTVTTFPICSWSQTCRYPLSQILTSRQMVAMICRSELC
jgi:hypothetical protein